MNNKENFYVVRRESGTFQRSDLLRLDLKSANPFALDKNVNAVSRAGKQCTGSFSVARCYSLKKFSAY